MTTMMSLADAHALLPGSRLMGEGATAIERVHTDTRSLHDGDLFVALRGERFDGHDYLDAAKAAGAVAALVDRGDQLLVLPMLPMLLVPDVLAALQTLAAAWRARHTLPLIAVTGSNGKTTVTQMAASILRAWLGDAALATAGNFNNHIGVPLTLLRLRPTHAAAVLELGMNHPGEIALLGRLAAPGVALINNAQREHLEFMSSVEAVARENGRVIEALGPEGTLVIPADDVYTPLWREMAAGRTVRTFAIEPGTGATVQGGIGNEARQHGFVGEADFTAQGQWDAASRLWQIVLRTPGGSVSTTLRQAGLHNVRNAIAAAACATLAGAPLDAVGSGLAAFEPVAGRSQLLSLQSGHGPVALIDDSYNANPDSVLAAIRLLADLPGPRWLLLGDMGEVGGEGPRFHAEVGAAARDAGIDHVWAVGALCAHAGADRHFGTVAALVEALAEDAPAANAVLVKGSRFMRMEQVVRALQQMHDTKESARAV